MRGYQGQNFTTSSTYRCKDYHNPKNALFVKRLQQFMELHFTQLTFKQHVIHTIQIYGRTCTHNNANKAAMKDLD